MKDKRRVMAANKAWKTIHKKQSEKAKKRKNAEDFWKYKNGIAYDTYDLLNRWAVGVEVKKVCPVCRRQYPESSFQEHHDPWNEDDSSSVWLCAGCHNIFNKIGWETKPEDVTHELKMRHRGDKEN